MSFEIEFKNILDKNGIEAIKDNFMLFSKLNDSKNKTRIDLAKIKMFYSLNAYLNLYDLISNNQTFVVFQKIESFIKQNPFNYSTINVLLCLEPLMDFVDKTGYGSFVRPFIKSQQHKTVKVVKGNEKERKQNFVAKNLNNKTQSNIVRNTVLNLNGNFAQVYLTDEDELEIINSANSQKKKIIPKNPMAETIVFNVNCKKDIVDIYIPKKYSTNLTINFSGSSLSVNFDINYKCLGNLFLKSNALFTTVVGNFNTLEVYGTRIAYITGFALNSCIKGFTTVSYCIQTRSVLKNVTRSLQIEASIIKIFSPHSLYPKIHTRLKHIYHIRGIYHLSSYKYDFNIKSNYKKIIIK